MNDVLKTYERLTPREKEIAEKMHEMLEFIDKGDALTIPEAKTGHAYAVVGWAEGIAAEVLRMLGEQP